MLPPFRAYEGDEPYIFVSYSHADADSIYPELIWLHEQGFNVWYDEGISPGESWRNELVNAISGCDLFLIFITPNSTASEHCIREVNFAQNKGRPLLAVHLEPTQLSDELEFNLSDRQALVKHNLSDSVYHRKMLERLRLVLHATASAQLDVPARPSPTVPLIAVVLTSLVVAVLAGLYSLFGPKQPEITTTQVIEKVVPEEIATRALPNSIAVLPFENLSPSDENAYFAAGVHEDVLLSLSKIGELTVIAKKSVQRYANSELSVAEIGEELNVANLLQGSVRRAGDKVRVSVSLVDATTSTTLWGETYDRTLTDIFVIQSEIAGEITSQLSVSMDLDVSRRIASAPTDNFGAYEKFMQARAANDPTTKIKLLTEAVELDPDFSAAHAELSLQTVGTLSFLGNQAIDYDVARKHAQIAYDQAPNSPVALRALARLNASLRHAETADRFYEQAVTLTPNDASLLNEQAQHLIMRGDSSAGFAVLRRLLVLDPNSADANIAMADVLVDELRSDEIEPYLQKALRLSAGSLSIRRSIALTYSRAGHQVESVGLITDILRDAPNSIVDMVWAIMILSVHYDFEAAEKWDARLRSLSPEVADVAIGVTMNVSERNEFEYEMAKIAVAAHPEDRDYLTRMAYGASGQARKLLREERASEATKKWQEAIGLLDRSMASDLRDGEVEIRTDNMLPYVVRALLLDVTGESETAQLQAKDFLAFRQAQPALDRITGHFLDGIAKCILRDHQGALDSFLKIETESTGFLFVYWFEVFGLKDGLFEVYGDLPTNIAFKDLVHRLEQRQRARAEQLRERFPTLFDASIGLNRLQVMGSE
jgi:TolB-like protein/Tfp pilus assembly protein PilF